MWRGPQVPSPKRCALPKVFCLPCAVSPVHTMSQSNDLGLVGSPAAAITAEELDAGPTEARIANAEGAVHSCTSPGWARPGPNGGN